MVLDKNWRENFRLTRNFWLREFYVSSQHPKIAAQMVPTKEQAVKFYMLCVFALQPIRDEFGRTTVTNGFRSRALNKLVGGAPTGQHLEAEAGDIICPNVGDMMQVMEFCKDELKWEGELILYPNRGHLHIGLPSPFINMDQFVSNG